MDLYSRYVEIGIAYLKDGELKEGIRGLEKSCTLKPPNDALLEHLACARYLQKLQLDSLLFALVVLVKTSFFHSLFEIYEIALMT